MNVGELMNVGERRELAKCAVSAGALLLGKYVLKSGKESNFFFDISKLNDGKSAAFLGSMYAKLIQSLQIPYDMLFGPAYKGISLAALAAASLFLNCGRNVGYVYNRKEDKTYGEKSRLPGGSSLNGKQVIIVDDVLTAGAAAREAIKTLEANGARAVALVVCFDRQEKINGGALARTKLENIHRLHVRSLFSFSDLESGLQKQLRLQR